MRKSRKYKGVNITPDPPNMYGLRWTALLSTGRVRSDTLAGIKRMISDAQEGKLTGASSHLNYPNPKSA